jgi:hypothetical protein
MKIEISFQFVVLKSKFVSKQEDIIHTAEPLVPDPSPSEAENDTVKLQKYKLLGSDQIRAGGETLSAKTHKLIKSIWSKEELVDQWTLPLHKFAREGISYTTRRYDYYTIFS